MEREDRIASAARDGDGGTELEKYERSYRALLEQLRLLEKEYNRLMAEIRTQRELREKRRNLDREEAARIEERLRLLEEQLKNTLRALLEQKKRVGEARHFLTVSEGAVKNISRRLDRMETSRGGRNVAPIKKELQGMLDELKEIQGRRESLSRGISAG